MKEYESQRIGRFFLLHTLPTIQMPGGKVSAGMPFLLNCDFIETIAPSECGKAVIVTANASYHVEEMFDEVVELMVPVLPHLPKLREKAPQ